MADVKALAAQAQKLEAALKAALKKKVAAEANLEIERKAVRAVRAELDPVRNALALLKDQNPETVALLGRVLGGN